MVAGDWPAFTEISSGGASVSVSDDTDGTASLSEWRLHLSHDGSDLISDVISSIDPTADDVSVMSINHLIIDHRTIDLTIYEEIYKHTAVHSCYFDQTRVC